MLSYLCIFIYLVALYIIIYNSHVSKKIFLFFALFSLFLLSSLRDISMGADAENYLLAFRTITMRGTYYMESGYVLYNRLIGKLTDNYSLMIAANCLLFYLPLYKYLKDTVDPAYWPICVFIVYLQPYFFLQTTFNVMRQACSVGILLMGMMYYSKQEKGIKRIFVFSLSAIIAAQFHRSAYFALIIPFLQFINWTVKKWRIALIVSVLLNVLNVSGLVRILAGLFGFNKYYNYSSSLLNNPAYLLLIIVLVLVVTNKYEVLIAKAKSKQVLDFYIFSLIFLIFAVSNDMIYRVYIMFAILSLPAIPVVIDGVSRIKISINKKKFNAYGAVLICYYIFFFFGYIWYLSRSGNTAYIPYRFCF